MTALKKHLVAALQHHLSGSAHTVPAGGTLLLEWFGHLSAARTYHAAGPNPITYGDIAAYGALMRIDLQPRHIEILRALDDAFLEHVHRRPASAPEGVKRLPPVNVRPMTAALFDAMMGGA